LSSEAATDALHATTFKEAEHLVLERVYLTIMKSSYSVAVPSTPTESDKKQEKNLQSTSIKKKTTIPNRFTLRENIKDYIVLIVQLRTKFVVIRGSIVIIRQ